MPIIHLIGCCIGWSACVSAQSRSTKDLLEWISLAWVQVFGGMATFILDGEIGMKGREVDDWARYNQVTVRHKAPHQEAWLVEMQNA